MLNLTINGNIPSKKNRYQISRGRMYKPKEITDFEYSALMQLRGQYKKDPIETDVEVTMKFYLLRDKDGDNLFTTIADCLQNAGVIKNDKQITAGHWYKYKIFKADGDESCDCTININ